MSCHQLSLCRRQGLYCYWLLVAVSRKLCCLCSVKQVSSGRMGGQGCFKHAWERRRRCGWTRRIRRGVRRRKKQVCSFFLYCICGRSMELGVCGSKWLLFDFRCASNYTMAGIVFFLVLDYMMLRADNTQRRSHL